MKMVSPASNQIITTRDFPVHSAEVLEKYFEIYANGQGDDLPPVPLMRTHHLLPHFDKPESDLLKEYLAQNPLAEYFLLNGSHRTTAADLTKRRINGMLLETHEDIETACEITFRNKPYRHGLLPTIEENIHDLVTHFSGTDKFWSVREKTDKMVRDTVIPKYMFVRD